MPTSSCLLAPLFATSSDVKGRDIDNVVAERRTKDSNMKLNPTRLQHRFTAAVVFFNLGLTGTASAQHSNTDLAKAAQNPLASMISLPFQNNTNFNYGPRDKTQNTLDIQPILPFELNEDWKLITRTILPVVDICITTQKSRMLWATGQCVSSFS